MALSDAKASVVSCIGLRAGAAGITSSGPVSFSGNQIVSGNLQVGGAAQVTGTVTSTAGFAGPWSTSGVATVPAGAIFVAVANTAITANSVVVATLSGPVDPDLLYVATVELAPGVGFTIRCAGVGPAADIPVSWAIMKY